MSKKQRGHKDFVPNTLYCVRNQLVCLQPHVCKPVKNKKLKKWVKKVTKLMI